MNYVPNKVFILENGSYAEISYEELCRRTENDQSYEEKLFLPLHGMLMEVAEDGYRTFYKNVPRQKYLKELSTANGDFSYDMLTTDYFNGQDILVDEKQDVEEIVEKNLMLNKLSYCLSLLSAEEKELIQMIFVEELTEREIAKQQGISQVVVHKKKQRIIKKLRKNFVLLRIL